MKTSMQWSYLFKIWLAPLLTLLFLSFITDGLHSSFIIFGIIYLIIYTLPAYVVCAIVFNILKTKAISIIRKKILLITTLIIVFFITGIMLGELTLDTETFIYVFIIIFFGLIFRLERKLPADPNEAN